MDTGHDPRDYRTPPRDPRVRDHDERITELEKRVASLYAMIERRDKKIAKLQRAVR